ncbi:MAG: FAD-dependent oxidoreductase [Candidatus Shapirobacteria bacterium]
MYDLIIVGAGPAGLTASIYASRYRLSNLVVGQQLGGTITLAHKVENFPGFESISGLELAQKMANQAKKLGGEIILAGVDRIEKGEKGYRAHEDGGENRVWKAKTLIITTGTRRRKLEIPGEKEYLGRGVSYCTNCDAPFFKDKVVAVVGGSDAAVSGAIHLSGFAGLVYLIYRKDQLRAEPMWNQQAVGNSKIKVIYKTNVIRIIGEERVGSVELDKEYLGKKELAVDGVFIEIGGTPGSNLLARLGGKTDKAGFVIVDEKMATNLPGVFAAGDFTNQSKYLSQAIIACAQGATAAFSAFKYDRSI